MFKASFRLKVISSYILLIVIPFFFVALVLDKKLEQGSLQDIKSSLIKQAVLIQDQLVKEDLSGSNPEKLNELAGIFAAQTQSRVTVIGKTGIVLADSQENLSAVALMDNHSSRPEIKTALAGLAGENVRYSNTLKINMLYIALPIKSGENVLGAVRVALPLSQVNRILSFTRNTIFTILFFALVLALIIGVLLSRSIIKPINRIIYVSRKFGQGDFGHRIYHDSRDEIGELVFTLNNMAGEIESKINEVEIQNQQLRAIFQSMVEGIIVVDKSAAVVTINPPVERIFGVDREKVKGELFLRAIANNDIAEIIESVLGSGRFLSKELSIVWPVSRIFQINASPIFQQKEVTGCLLVLHDISEIRRLETIRSDFVANVSHELKTPLTSIKGFVETLIEGALEDKDNARNFLQIIQEHTDRLNNLINDLLDLSYLESEAAALSKSEIRIKDLADKVLNGFGSQLAKRSIRVSNELEPGLSVRADLPKIEQVLTNLVDNAIKFNRNNGSIRISSLQLERGLKIVVEDSGTGIPAKDIPRIFERFYRVDKARSRQLGGTGLGLSIVKHIVELHQGEAGVESVENLGSKFWFILPK